MSAERGGGVFGGVAYSAAKAAQLGFARALARELGSNGIGQQCRSRAHRHRHRRWGTAGSSKAQLLARIPVGRNGNVADLITYLRLEESGYITGASYDVNGGSHIR